MKDIRFFLMNICICAILLPVFHSCTDLEFLNQEPISSITPEAYFIDDAQVSAYVINCYGFLLTSGKAAEDCNTDNQGTLTSSHTTRFSDLFKTAQSGGDWSFTNIRRCNYFFQHVLPKWKAGAIAGNQTYINHYIGEMYFLRAVEYFKKLVSLGDFPIVRSVLPDDMLVLTEASKRAPRNEVARFILADLDSAKLLMQPVAPDGNKNRISRHCALLFGARVALFEATWEKYFKGTAFVPNGPDWPGKSKDYNASYQFPSGNIDNEIAFFLDRAIADSKAVADNFTLTENTYLLQQDKNEPKNPYFNMFSDVDMKPYNEVLLWRRFNSGLSVGHGENSSLHTGSINITRGFVESFLMKNGLPIYAEGSGYLGDDDLQTVKTDRDNRLFLFLKVPGEKNILIKSGGAVDPNVQEIHPPASVIAVPGYPKYSAAGYDTRKGMNFDDATLVGYVGNAINSSGIIVFRAVEAYLIYMEASFEKTGTIDATADKYWKAIRVRAGIDPDYTKTIAATEMAKETLDWGAYSAGKLINPTLYNIRRERRCEFLTEAFRNQDILRWRAMDQMITTPYHVEGFKFWGPVIQYQYPAASIIYDKGSANTVSSPTRSIYFRPYEILESSALYNGFKWKMAHYLNPIATDHFMITSGDGTDTSKSPIYQNPGWPIPANQSATN